MPKQDYYKTLFLVGAVWNWVATVSFAVGYTFMFPLFDMALPRYPVFFLLFLGLAFSFGIGYYLVSRDIFKNHAVVIMGIVGKLIVFVGLLWAWLCGDIHFIPFSAGIVDLLFAVLFIEFLMTVKKAG